MMPPGLVRIIKVCLSLVVFLAVWQIACRLFHVPSFLLPTPSDIAMRLWEKRDLYASHTWVTFYETVGGFVLAVLGGCFAAALIVMIPSLRDIIMPLLLIAQIVPKVA